MSNKDICEMLDYFEKDEAKATKEYHDISKKGKGLSAKEKGIFKEMSGDENSHKRNLQMMKVAHRCNDEVK